MKTIHDIFASKKIKTKIEKPKTKIIIDYREKNSLVASELVSLGYEIEFKELKVADYLIRDIAIERKTVNDFISSMINKRLIRQLEEIQQYEKRLIILEGIEEQELYSDEDYTLNGEGVNPNAIRGFILSILIKYQVPIVFSKNATDTAKYIHVLAKKKETEMSIRAIKKSLSKEEQMQFILEGFPGIGPKTARKLLEEFKSLKNIFNAPKEEIEKIAGKKSEIFSLLNDSYRTKA